MAGGGFAVDTPTTGGFDGKLTLSILVTCIVAATSGLLFGYDIGISGGVTTMVPFLEKFFPDILRKAAGTEVNMYCVYDSQILTLFTSSLYLAGLVSSLLASRVTTAIGRRRNTIMLGGAVFLAGGAINGGSENITMLILGRILLGFGVGFTNQAAPLYLSEIAPPKWRGAFNTGFQFFLGVGVWSLQQVMTIGAFLITDTPSSLVERGKIDQARKALRKVRGSTIDVEPELEELIKWSEIAKSVEQEPFKTIFERQYRPHLVLAFAIPFFQQLTGINIVAFYSPNLFQSVGLGHDAALLSAIILGLVNLASILISTGIVDRFGRRFLFITGGIMILRLSAVLAAVTGVHGTKDISKGNAILVLVLLCLYAAGFGWSWGPLTWLIPSEIFPLKIRTTGQSIAVAVAIHNMMTFFVLFFLPETKGIPLESMYTIWGKHWFWRRFVKGEDGQDNLP
ncbi:Sugar/inositol transporter [Sesbania bispinosa]|nr:Sugar/inositol transporter [Sesbania bispinosa]